MFRWNLVGVGGQGRKGKFKFHYVQMERAMNITKLTNEDIEKMFKFHYVQMEHEMLKEQGIIREDSLNSTMFRWNLRF